LSPSPISGLLRINEYSRELKEKVLSKDGIMKLELNETYPFEELTQ